MKNKDIKLIEEAYGKIQEGIWDQMKAKSGTRLAGIGNKVLGGVQRVAGNTRLGQAAGQLKQVGEMDVEEKRASQLTATLAQKLDKLYNEFMNDAQKVGVDINKLAQQDFQKTGQYPALEGISEFLRNYNAAKAAISKKIAPPQQP